MSLNFRITFYIFRINTLKCDCWVKKITWVLNFLSCIFWYKRNVISCSICIHHRHFCMRWECSMSEVWTSEGLVWTEHFFFWQEWLSSQSCLSASLNGSTCCVWLHPIWSFTWSQPIRQSDKRPSININGCSAHGSGLGLARSSGCKSVFHIEVVSLEIACHHTQWGNWHQAHFLKTWNTCMQIKFSDHSASS